MTNQEEVQLKSKGILDEQRRFIRQGGLACSVMCKTCEKTEKHKATPMAYIPPSNSMVAVDSTVNKVKLYFIIYISFPLITGWGTIRLAQGLLSTH